MDKCSDEHFQGTFYSQNNDEPLILCLVAVKGSKPQALKADILDHCVASTNYASIFPDYTSKFSE